GDVENVFTLLQLPTSECMPKVVQGQAVKDFHASIVFIFFSLRLCSLGCGLKPSIQDVLRIERLAGASLEDETGFVLAFHPAYLQLFFEFWTEINVTFRVFRLW